MTAALKGPNLDLNDTLVKRGLLVSWHGHRATVLRVRTGRCLVNFKADGFQHGVIDVANDGRSKWLPCASVQVVKP